MDPVHEAVRVLRRDGIVVYPTETVYGLGADALSDEAVLRVYDAKQRPHSQPVSVAVADMEMMAAVAFVDGIAEAFAERFLPGPVTVVLKMKRCLPPILAGGTGLIGIRIPDHPVAIRIIEELDAPITSTSANRTGEPAPTRPAEVTVPHDYLVDGGELLGTPSTVVDLVNRTILRKGARWEDVEAFLREWEGCQ